MEVIPVALTDQQPPSNNIRTRDFFIVDDGDIDESVLKSALDSLIRNHWRKLGARLATRSDRLLEYHVPPTFDDDYALFNWSSTEYGHSIDERPELRFFHHPPPAEAGITFLPSLESIDTLVRPASWPYERKDEPPNAPLLYIHLSLFTDATVIAISCPHTLSDQLSVSNITRAWFGLTRGETPPLMVGYDQDVLDNGKKYTDYPKDEVVRKGKVRVRWPFEYFFVVLVFISEFIMNPKEESNIAFFPRPYVNLLRKRFTAQLEEKYGVDPGLSIPGRIPQLASVEQQRGFIHNVLIPGAARIQIAPTTPASELAYTSRRMIMESTVTTPKDLEIGTVIGREMSRRGQPTHLCEPFDRSYKVLNWCAAWRGLEISCGTGIGTRSTVNTSKTSDGNTSPGEGKKTLVLGQSTEFGIPQRFCTTIMSQSKEGFWCECTAPLAAKELIKELLKRDPMLENF